MAVRVGTLPGRAGTVRRAPSTWTRLARNGRVRGGTLILLIILLGALAAPLLATTNPQTPSPAFKNLPPLALVADGSRSVLGTDALGRDLWSRILYGARISLLTGSASVLVALLIGLPLGLLAGYLGGRVDTAIMRWVDIQLAIPFFLLAITIAAVLGQGLVNVILLLGITSWVGYTRVVRAQVLIIRELAYIEAARALGCGSWTILVRHILPNTWTPILILASQQVGSMIIAESSLTFLGIGVPPDIATWGAMIAFGRSYLATAWWVSTIPGLALTITVVAVYFLGDGLRDALDPRLKRT